MRLTKIFAAIAIAIVLVRMATAAPMDDKIRSDFFAGFAGDEAALVRAVEASTGDTSAEALAWHGGGLLVLSGQKFKEGDFAAGGELWGRAIAEMDKAGALEPDNPAVLIPRASVWFGASRQVPPERAKPLIEKALADYEHVYELQKSYFDTLSVHMRSELLFGLADGHRRDGNPDKARLYFEKLAAIGPPSGHFAQATQYLKGEAYMVQGGGCAGCHTGK